jgi:hypothetical protein
MIYLLRRRHIGRAKPGYVEAIAASARAWKLPERYIESVERWAGSGFVGARPVDMREGTGGQRAAASVTSCSAAACRA